MPEIILEISLNRSSGVLAGIVASLAQAGIELKSQKLRRATEGRGGWLTVVGSGDSPEPAVLAERLNGTRGVEKLMRVIVDGEAILAEGKPLADQIQHDDLAELSAGSDTEVVERRDTPRPASPAAPDRKAHGSVPDIEDLPILSEPEPEHPSPSVAEPEVELEPELEPEPEPEPGPELEPELEPEPEPEPENELELEKDSARDLEAARADTAPGIDTDPVEHALGEALGQAREALDQEEPAPEFHPQPTAEGDLAEALHVEADTEGNDEASTVDEGGKNPAQVGAVLRRRRRRRR